MKHIIVHEFNGNNIIIFNHYDNILCIVNIEIYKKMIDHMYWEMQQYNYHYKDESSTFA